VHHRGGAGWRNVDYVRVRGIGRRGRARKIAEYEIGQRRCRGCTCAGRRAASLIEANYHRVCRGTDQLHFRTAFKIKVTSFGSGFQNSVLIHVRHQCICRLAGELDPGHIVAIARTSSYRVESGSFKTHLEFACDILPFQILCGVPKSVQRHCDQDGSYREYDHYLDERFSALRIER
jgi:hypothetical protein